MINSKDNKYVKEVISLKNKKYRNKLNLFLMEGTDFLEDIPEAFNIKYFLIKASFSKDFNEKFSKFGKTLIVADDVFDKCSDTVNSKGVLCVIEKKFVNYFIKEQMKILVCDNIQDPGNFGTIIRTCESAGFDLILATRGCCDLYNLKTIRSTAGAIFHIPIIIDLGNEEIMEFLQSNSISLYTTSLDAKDYYYNVDYTDSFAFCVGNESNGVSEFFQKNASKLIKIPMIGKSQSLNVAIATSILVYDAVRQNIK